MAIPVVLKGPCDGQLDIGTCERPEFPSWAWRFNRNQHMTHYTPWQIRAEQMPPRHRNMGMHRNFRFHPMGAQDGPTPMVQLGVNYAHHLVNDRKSGFGNAALGNPPGPAPPVMFGYGFAAEDELYRVNEIHNISPGMSMLGYQPLFGSWTEGLVPLNPSHYIGLASGHQAEIPGTFPNFNKSLPSSSHRPSRECITPESATPCGQVTLHDPLTIWRDRFAKQQARHAMERCFSARSMCVAYQEGAPLKLPSICVRPPKCKSARA